MFLRREQGEKAVGGVGGIWLLTFNDMMTLLLTFFVLMLSMSKMDVSKVEEATNAVGSAFGLSLKEEKPEARVFDSFIFTTGDPNAAVGRGAGAAQGDDGAAERFLAKREALIGRYSGRSGVTAKATPQGVRVNIENGILFSEGSAEFRTANLPELSDLSALVEGGRTSIRVSAGTEETPADRARFSSGWELAAARAARVAEFMISRGGADPSKMSVSAYGAVKSSALKSGSLRNRGVEMTLTFHDS